MANHGNGGCQVNNWPGSLNKEEALAVEAYGLLVPPDARLHGGWKMSLGGLVVPPLPTGKDLEFHIHQRPDALSPEDRDDPNWAVNNDMWRILLKEECVARIASHDGLYGPPLQGNMEARHQFLNGRSFYEVLNCLRAEQPIPHKRPAQARRRRGFMKHLGSRASSPPPPAVGSSSRASSSRTSSSRTSSLRLGSSASRRLVASHSGAPKRKAGGGGAQAAFLSIAQRRRRGRRSLMSRNAKPEPDAAEEFDVPKTDETAWVRDQRSFLRAGDPELYPCLNKALLDSKKTTGIIDLDVSDSSSFGCSTDGGDDDGRY